MVDLRLQSYVEVDETYKSKKYAVVGRWTDKTGIDRVEIFYDGIDGEFARKLYKKLKRVN